MAQSLSKDGRRVLQWIKMAGRVRFMAEGDNYRISSEKHKQTVLLTLDELNLVNSAAGTMAVYTFWHKGEQS